LDKVAWENAAPSLSNLATLALEVYDGVPGKLLALPGFSKETLHGMSACGGTVPVAQACKSHLTKAPALTLPQARLLVESSFPELKRQPSYVLTLLAYHTRRNYQAYLSHRQRRIKELQ